MKVFVVVAALAVEAPASMPSSVRSEKAVNSFIKVTGVFWSNA